MTAHELAHKLLDGPNDEVFFRPSSENISVMSIESVSATTLHRPNCCWAWLIERLQYEQCNETIQGVVIQ